MPSVNQFRFALRSLFDEAESRGSPYVEINAGQLHRKLGGYPGPKHQMPSCCQAMYDEQKAGDQVIRRPPQGKGASLSIRYRLPRSATPRSEALPRADIATSPESNIDNKYSGYKIGQTAWFVVSVYLGVVFTDLAKDGLFKAIMTPEGHLRTLSLIIPTLLLYLITTIEAYVWLSEDEQIPGQEAVLRCFRLFIYLAAILFQALLTYALTSDQLHGDERYFTWAKSFGWVLFWYAIYNACWILHRLFVDDKCPTKKQIFIYISFYGIFASIFFFSKELLHLNWFRTSRPEIALCVLYVLYIVPYVILSRNWYRDAFRLRSGTSQK
jgi:hypothetical protein